MSPLHFGAKFQRSIEELLVSPVPTHVVIADFGVSPVVFVLGYWSLWFHYFLYH